MSNPASTPLAIVRQYADSLKSKFDFVGQINPEDQLKGPVGALVMGFGELLSMQLETVTEVQRPDLSGRPDVGVSRKRLLVGYVELKAPGKGANPARLTGADLKQWKKFQDLPNLIYTDGIEWALYRSGERVGKVVRAAGDLTEEGARAVDQLFADGLLELLRDFFLWEPQTPANPRALAQLLAPICRLLRSDVLEALADPDSNLSAAARDWRQYLFPDADDHQFADAYAQTLTYALLLARLSDAGATLSIASAVRTIHRGHELLADALKILGDDNAVEEIRVPVDLLERVVAAVNPAALIKNAKGDPWLYFYEDFLAAYDPKMRNDRGVYYTPVEAVQAQVRLTAELLREHFGKEYAFVSPGVVTLDPAAGTGTYILAALDHGLDLVEADKGKGMRAHYAGEAAKNLHAFEILVGPYAVAHLRLTQRILAEGGALPKDGAHVYLTDTLESPHKPTPVLPMLYKELGQEHRRAQQVKANVPVLVCIGNPPYDRQQIAEADKATIKHKGGWVVFGDTGVLGSGIFKEFLTPLGKLGLGIHAKNLYNDYVYFWRWALWKVFEAEKSGGIVCFITASSYLRGPGFAGMRRVMRETFDRMWIIDLEGDNLGAHKTENIFAIRTPVAICVGVRYGAPNPGTPAEVLYTRIEGKQEEKLAKLAAIQRFGDLTWRTCLSGFEEPMLPVSSRDYWRWPKLTDVFPWQENGVQFKRTWPIAAAKETLSQRWRRLVTAPANERGGLLRETGAVTVKRAATSWDGRALAAIRTLDADSPTPPFVRYAYRSFDRQWMIRDVRLCDRPRPNLQRSHSNQQVYLTSLLTNVLGFGPVAVATDLIPDLHHFRGSFGGKHVIPLWHDAEATAPNVVTGLLDHLSDTYGFSVGAVDLFAYAYALLATPLYVERFWDELTIPGPRLPITKDGDMFRRAVELGNNLLWVHTYGERLIPEGKKRGWIPRGKARSKVGTPSTPERYPESYKYDCAAQELHVGDGVFEQVRPAVWNFSVSGLRVVESWLAYRMRGGAGRKSSPLDEIRPQRWEFDEELLYLLWVLDYTIDLMPDVNALFEQVVAGDLFLASELPTPTGAERLAYGANVPLLDMAQDEEVEDEQ
jgi:hypothetical protein